MCKLSIHLWRRLPNGWCPLEMLLLEEPAGLHWADARLHPTKAHGAPSALRMMQGLAGCGWSLAFIGLAPPIPGSWCIVSYQHHPSSSSKKEANGHPPSSGAPQRAKRSCVLGGNVVSICLNEANPASSHSDWVWQSIQDPQSHSTNGIPTLMEQPNNNFQLQRITSDCWSSSFKKIYAWGFVLFLFILTITLICYCMHQEYRNKIYIKNRCSKAYFIADFAFFEQSNKPAE